MKRLEQDRGRAPKARPTHADRGAATKEEAPAASGAARYAVDSLPGAETAPEATLAAFDRALVQCRAALAGAPPEAAVVQRAAVSGVSGNGAALPFAERIQRAFGRHDVSHVRAYTGGAASDAARTMGAMAYATGNRVAFRGTPDLHTAAHEAAHVVQQRRGIALKGGVGQAGDVWERHADAVADRVVRGMSAEDLLGPVSNGAAARHDGAVQKKVYLGEGYDPLGKSENDAVQKLIADDVTRRFASEAEAGAFAAGQAEGCGALPDGTWVRVDRPLTVLGEHHGNSQAPALIKATRIHDFRYEGIAHHNPNRMAADAGFNQRVKDEDQEFLKKIDGSGQPDGHDHFVEDALPLYARVVPDVLAYAKGAIDELDGAVVSHMADALRFARTYQAKWFHEIARFIRSHRAAVEAAIPEFDKVGPDRTRPDKNVLPSEMLTAMNEAFTSAAQRKVGLARDKARNQFEESLGDAKTCASAEAEANDRLRDKSMLDTILSARDERLFVIGDGHRQRLAKLLSKHGITHMKDSEYVEREKDRNAAADHKVPQSAMPDLAAMRVAPIRFPNPSLGQSFTLEAPNGCEWRVSPNCREVERKDGKQRFRVEAAGMVQLSLVWSAGERVVRTHSFLVPRANPSRDVGFAGPGNVPPPQPLAAAATDDPTTNAASADPQVVAHASSELSPPDLD